MYAGLSNLTVLTNRTLLDYGVQFCLPGYSLLGVFHHYWRIIKDGKGIIEALFITERAYGFS